MFTTNAMHSSELEYLRQNHPSRSLFDCPITVEVPIDDRYDSKNILDGIPTWPRVAFIPGDFLANAAKPTNDKDMDFPVGPQNPDILFNKLLQIENHRPTLRKNVKFILKMFLAKYGVDSQNTKISANNSVRFKRLIDQYDLEKSKTLLTWAFPEIFYSLLKKYPTKFEHSDKLMRDYKNFRLEYQNVGLLSLLPKGEKYGGFVKVLLNLYLLQSGETEMNEMCLKAALVLFKSTLLTEGQRQEFFKNMKINETETAMWSAVFDKKFPQYMRVYKKFEQTA